MGSRRKKNIKNMKTLKPKKWEEKLFGITGLFCCKVCQCQNGKKLWCACHRKQIQKVIQQERQEEREKARKVVEEHFMEWVKAFANKPIKLRGNGYEEVSKFRTNLLEKLK